MIDDYKFPFDLYEYQDVILFDEFRSPQVELYKILRWTDMHPVVLPCRYNNKQACYTKIYFTSNVPLDSLYSDTKFNEPKTYDAFMRRIHNVYNFDNPIEIQKFLAGEPNPNPYNINQTGMTPVTDENLPF